MPLIAMASTFFFMVLPDHVTKKRNVDVIHLN